MNNENKIPENEFHNIERFLNGEMDPDEHALFLENIADNQELQNSVREIQLLQTAIQEATLRKDIDRYHEQIKSPGNRKQNYNVRSGFRIFAAAATILLVGSLVAIFIYNAADQEQTIFSNYYKPDPGLMSTMGVTDNYQFERAMIDYKTGNYQEALTAWKTLSATNPENDTINYFIASAYLADGKSAESIPYFEKVIESSNSIFSNDAHWYSALALIREGKPGQAIPLIERSSHSRKEELLETLK